MNKRKNEKNIRKKGQFYTPKLFCDYAHDMIAKEFGEDWKEKYVVWDNSAGLKNLTRDYYFNELYSSTLENAELEISKNYNKEATSFQFDFLNDDLDKLPNGLIEAFEQNKPIIFFMNPPYAASSNMGTKNGSKGKGATTTMISKEMKAKKLGKAGNNLYTQFIYRIMMIKRQYNLTDCHICMFTPPSYITGGSWKGFRKELFNDFSYEIGYMFNAGYFSDVSSLWGITFSIWKCGINFLNTLFHHYLIDVVDGKIKTIGEKILYNLDGNETASEWVREPIKGLKTYDVPNLTSAIRIKEINTSGKSIENALGYFYNNSNNINKNDQNVGMFSSPFAAANGLSINNDNFTICASLFAARRLVQKNWINWADEYMKPIIGYFYNNSNNVNKNASEVALFSTKFSATHGLYATDSNFARCTSLFAARTLVKGNWINDKDEYMKPDTNHPMWNEFVNDSIVYSLFNTKSNQSSLRQIDYKGKKWDIKNEFFWMSKDEMKQLANDNNNDECYNDANVSNDRYVYTLLKDIELSNEAQAVLDKASDIVRKTFKYRQLFNEENESYQINNFDCGWHQIKALAKEYAKDDLEEFKTLYKKLSDKMLPMVYELGFLLDGTIM